MPLLQQSLDWIRARSPLGNRLAEVAALHWRCRSGGRSSGQTSAKQPEPVGGLESGSGVGSDVNETLYRRSDGGG